MIRYRFPERGRFGVRLTSELTAVIVEPTHQI
jgi:hypothetical protein